MDWDDIRVFVAVAQAGSLAAGARRLRLSQATVWRRMRALDTALDAVLFERRATGYVLSAQGAAFLRALEGVEHTIATARRQLSEGSEGVEGEVRIAGPEFLAPILARRLPELAERHPRLELETVSASPLAPLGMRDADIAIRTDRPLVAGFRITGTYQIPCALFAARAYIEQHGTPASLRDLAGHRLIEFDHSIAHAAPLPWRDADLSAATVVFRSSSPHARLSAARAGLGLAMLPRCLVGDDPTLHEVLPDAVGALELFLCVNAALSNQARIAATLTFLDGSLRALA